MHPLIKLFNEQSSLYRLKEIGDGTHDFTRQSLELIFGLTPKSSLVSESNLFGESLYDNFYVYEGSKKQGASARRDFRCKINGQIVVVEVERLDNIEAGMKQIGGYMKAENTHFGIVTDGGIWRFFKYGVDKLDQYETLTIQQLCSTDGQAFLQNFYNSYDFYLNRLQTVETKVFDTQIFHQGLITTAERIVFDLRHIGLFTGSTQEIAKEEIQTAYSLIIQILLIKIVQDKRKINLLKKDVIIDRLKEQDRNGIFEAVEQQIKRLGDFYVPYHNQQDGLLNKIITHYQQGSRIARLNLDSVRLFLDLYHFIYSFDFYSVKQDLFGAVYENYLKELYKDDDTKKGQVFTPPEIVDFMLDEVGYTVAYIQSTIQENLLGLKDHLDDHTYNIPGLSLIDPACGSGTFLYKSAGRIVHAVHNIQKETHITDEQAGKIAELIICNNLVGFDIEPFPLYLAEMNILQWLLFFNVSSDGNILNSIDVQIKIFSTEDSIAEFHNLESSMEKDLQDLISGGDFATLASKRDPKSILQLKADLQDFDREALMTKFQLQLYYKILKNDFFIVDSGELITTKRKTYREQHHKKIFALTTIKDLVAYVRDTLDNKYLGLFETNVKIIKPQLEHIRSKFSEIITKAQTKRTKFDFVVANPPYVKGDAVYNNENLYGHNINDPKYAQIHLHNGKSIRIGNSQFNIYGYFYYLGFFLLKDGGKLSYITPRSILQQPSFHKLRQFIKQNLQITKIFDFGLGSLFYQRGLNQNVLVATDSAILEITKTTANLKQEVKIEKYIGKKGNISLHDFALHKTSNSQLYGDVFDYKGYLFTEYFDALKNKDDDFHISIYPRIPIGTKNNKSNINQKGYAIFKQKGYYSSSKDIERRYDYDSLGAVEEYPTTKEIQSKKYRLTRSSTSGRQKRNLFTFTDYLHIHNWNAFTSLGVNKEENVLELYYLFGLLNSSMVQHQLQEDFGGICNMTNLSLLQIPLLNTPTKLQLKIDLIANSEAIIFLCKLGSSGGVQTRGDICETVFDPDSLGEKIIGLKSQYSGLGVAIPPSVQPSDVLPDDVVLVLNNQTSTLEKLEQERDQIVNKLYALE